MRAFFAVKPSEQAKQSLAAVLSALKEQYPSPTIRWSEIENLHITLQFIPTLNPENIPVLINNVQKELQGFHAFQGTLQGLIMFPDTLAPRVLSIGCEPHESFSALSSNIGKGLLATGYPIETRPFRGHLTLARMRENMDFTPTALPLIEPFLIKEILLYQSQPNMKGSHYTVMGRVTL
jgi:2'-5' RNA ligase